MHMQQILKMHLKICINQQDKKLYIFNNIMTVEISVSQKPKNPLISYNESGCSHIIDAFKKFNIEGKFVPNYSLMNNNLELGCTITMDKQYENKEKLQKTWDIIELSSQNNFFIKKYTCAHLKIDGYFSGCIFNYLKDDKCPHKFDIF